MADTKERVYVIPLRRASQRAPIYKRTKRAVNEIRYFISKHMKVDDVRIGSQLNELLWSRGNENPPHKIRVKTRKIENYAQVELEQYPYYEKKEKEEKKKEEVKAKETKAEVEKEKEVREEEKMVVEGKAKEIEKREVKHGPEPLKKEEGKSKSVEKGIKMQHRIEKTQKGLIKHPKSKKEKL